MSDQVNLSLEKLGLSDKESRIYIAALEMGKFSVLALANKTGIKRSTCYLILDELIKKGLISTFPKAKKVIYVAEHPNTLLKKTEESVRIAKTLMPELQSLMSTTALRPELTVYLGQQGIQQIYENMLDTGKDIHYLMSVEEAVEAAGKEYLDDWIRRRIAKGVHTYKIAIRDREIPGIALYDGTPENLRTTRYAPTGFASPYTIYIFGKKVAFVSTKKDLFGFIVESADLAISMKALFDVVWGISNEE